MGTRDGLSSEDGQDILLNRTLQVRCLHGALELTGDILWKSVDAK